MNSYQFDMLHWLKTGPAARAKGRPFADKHFSVPTGDYLASLGFVTRTEGNGLVIYAITPKGEGFIQTENPRDGEYERGYKPRFFIPIV